MIPKLSGQVTQTLGLSGRWMEHDAAQKWGFLHQKITTKSFHPPNKETNQKLRRKRGNQLASIDCGATKKHDLSKKNGVFTNKHQDVSASEKCWQKMPKTEMNRQEPGLATCNLLDSHGGASLISTTKLGTQSVLIRRCIAQIPMPRCQGRMRLQAFGLTAIPMKSKLWHERRDKICQSWA